MKKSKSIVILCIISVFIVLMAVFAVVSFPIANSVYNYTGYAKTIKLGLDMSGGVSAVYEVLPEGNVDDLDSRVDGAISSLQSLLVSKGYTEATVTKGNNSNGNTTIRVEVPNVDDPKRVLELIGRPATLEFKGENDVNAENLIVGRQHLENAYLTLDTNQHYAVGLKFNDEGTAKFSEATKEYLNKPLYIFINGQLYTSVNVQSQITNGSAIITNGDSGYEYQDALDFATRLQSGTFGVKLRQSEVRNISATLGENSIRTALIAGIVGVAIIFIFLAIVYRGLGLAADIALCVYIVLLLWFCAVLPWVQLTLPGIAGILLSIGMAVDANVIVFERIKDEYKHTTKPITTSVKEGFRRSTAAIIDGNVTTLIGAIVLWILGSSSIVGFAVTLFIGIILSMFTSLVITRLILKTFVSLNGESERFYGLKRQKEENTESEDGVAVGTEVQEA